MVYVNARTVESYTFPHSREPPALTRPNTMPELPEVETVCRTLRPVLIGSTFAGVSAFWEKSLQCASADVLATALHGARCENVLRRGKYICISLSEERWLIVHLRMTGRLTITASNDPVGHHDRVILHLDDGRDLRFADQRKFGRIAFVTGHAELRTFFAKVGPEPDMSSEPTPWHSQASGDRFSVRNLAAKLVNRRASIKSLLLDQSIVAGLGNIYVDEALFRARIHPETVAGNLKRPAIVRLVAAITDVLSKAIKNRGTTLADYRDALGERGDHQQHLEVFRRHGQPCPRCATTIIRIRVAMRGTHLCPRCQVLRTMR